jgi:hypothetical protein
MSDLQIGNVKVIDPRILQQEPVYKIEQGSGTVSYMQYAPNSSSTTNLSFNVIPTSKEVITDRQIKYDGSFTLQTTVTIAGEGDTTAAALKGKPLLKFGLNSTLIDHPLNHVFDTTQLQVNNVSVSNKSGTNFDMLKWMMNTPKDGLQKGTPSRLEMYQNYSGSSVFANSNLQGVGQANQYEAPPNGSFEGVDYCNPTGNILTGTGTYEVNGVNYAYINGIPVSSDTSGLTTGAVALRTEYVVFVRVTLVERAFISPMIFNETHDSQTGLYNIGSIDISHNLKQPKDLIKIDKLSKVAVDPDAAANYFKLATLDTKFSTNDPWRNMRLVMTYRTPSVYEQPPKVNTVPYNEFQTYTTTRGENILAGQKVKLTSDAIIPSSVANMILIAVKPISYANDETEYFLPTDSVSINFGNSSSLLNTASKQNLYEMSYKNGVQMSRAMWYGSGIQNQENYNNAAYTSFRGAGHVPLVGGFLALVPGVDFEINNTLAGGVGVQQQFQVTVDVQNRLNSTIAGVEIVVVFVNSGFIISQNGQSAISLMPITSQDVATVPIDMGESLSAPMVGGSFWNKVGSFLKNKVWKPVKAIASDKRVRDFAKEKLRGINNPMVNTGVDIAESFGMGVRTGGNKGLYSMYR